MNLSPVSADTTAPLTFDPQIHPENMRGVHAIEASAAIPLRKASGSGESMKVVEFFSK